MSEKINKKRKLTKTIKKRKQKTNKFMIEMSKFNEILDWNSNLDIFYRLDHKYRLPFLSQVFEAHLMGIDHNRANTCAPHLG